MPVRAECECELTENQADGIGRIIRNVIGGTGDRRPHTFIAVIDHGDEQPQFGFEQAHDVAL
jgi:hypothetical protein